MLLSLLLLLIFFGWAAIVRVGITDGSRESAWISRPFGEWPEEIDHVRNTSDIQFSIFATYELGDADAEVPETFGRPTVGSVVDTFDSENINGSRYVTGLEAGAVSSLSVYVPGPVDDAPNDQFELAIYDDADGIPSRRLATTTAAPITPDAWNTAPVSVVLQPRTAYWLFYNSNGTNGLVNNPTYSEVSGTPLDNAIRSHRSAALVKRGDQFTSLFDLAASSIMVVALALVAARRRVVLGVAIVVGFVAALGLAWLVREQLFGAYGKFPSGHALRASYVAVTAGLLFPRRLVVIAATLVVLLTAVASVYTSGHYSEEVIGGVLLGSAAAVAAWALGSGESTRRPAVPEPAATTA